LALPIRERLERKISRLPDSPGCWLWTGVVNQYGYGCIGMSTGARARARRWRPALAHRVAYAQYKGPIPADMGVLHRCDTRSCVNPEHLFLGTNADNTADMISKGRARFSCGGTSGENHWNAKLTQVQVDEIRVRLRGGEARVALARAYGVSYYAIRNIEQSKRWVGATNEAGVAPATRDESRSQGCSNGRTPSVSLVAPEGAE